MPVWLEIERKLSQMPGNAPVAPQFLDRVNYYGQAGELDIQGRVAIPPHLRDSASMSGTSRPSDASTYIDVWNARALPEEAAARGVDR